MGKSRLTRAEIRSRKAIRLARKSGDWLSYEQEQRPRRATRRKKRISSLLVQLPKGCALEVGTASIVTVTTPGGQTVRWDPTHNSVFGDSGRAVKLNPAQIARVVNSMMLDERDGIGGI